MKACAVCLACMLVAVGHVDAAPAKESPGTGLGFDKRINGKEVLKAVEPVRKMLQASSAAFFIRHDIVCYGLVMDHGGYIMTKASEVAGKEGIYARINDVKYDQVTILATDEATDLALVKVNALDLDVFEIDGETPGLGTIVISNGSSTRYSRRPKMGVISGMPRPIPHRDNDLAYLGVKFTEQCSIDEVVKNGPAARAGLKNGDIVIQAEQIPIAKLDDFGPVLNDKHPGDLLPLKVRRGNQELDIVMTLGSRREYLGEESLPVSRNDKMSGYVSNRRDGFEMVLEHDSPLSPSLMGGPLLDLDGKVRGLNIARANRAETFALPIVLVEKTYRKLLAEANRDNE